MHVRYILFPRYALPLPAEHSSSPPCNISLYEAIAFLTKPQVYARNTRFPCCTSVMSTIHSPSLLCKRCIPRLVLRKSYRVESCLIMDFLVESYLELRKSCRVESYSDMMLVFRVESCLELRKSCRVESCLDLILLIRVEPCWNCVNRVVSNRA